MRYKNTIVLLIALLWVSAGSAQTHIDSLKAIYEDLPTHLYPSQLLHNRSPMYQWSFKIDTNLQWQIDSNYTASPYLYPGNIPAPLIRKSQWTMLYNDMWHSCINPHLLVDAATFKTRDSIARITYEVPIAATHLDFERILPGAVDSGYLYYDTVSHKLQLMPDTLWIDRASNLYQYNPNPDSLAELAIANYETFAGALTQAAVYKQGASFTITFGLVSALFSENQTELLTSTEMDFDNGQGFVPVQFDVPKVVTYNTSTWDSYERQLRLRLHYGQKVVETTMPLVIVPNVKPADTVMYASELPYTCTIPTNGFTPDQARVSIRYGNPAKKLMKPVIVVEGFESAQRPYGDITYETISSGYITNADGERVFEQAELLKEAFDSLTLLGYDIVYVDNRAPRDYIQANMLNTIKTIQWVNGMLSANKSNEKLVVIGASMGGLLVRHALAKMEADGCCHNTRLYVTFDSPHNGANIPLGLQATVKHLRDELYFIDEFFFDAALVRPNWDDVLNSPGARQMLSVHYDASANAVRNAWLAEFDSLGHPQECRRVALINGSENALANTFTDGWKTMILCEPSIYLPKNHFVGTTWQPFANIVGIPAKYHTIVMNSFGEARSDGIVFQANDIELASLLAPIIGFTHGASVAVQIASFGISFIPGAAPVCHAIILGAQGVSNIALPALHYTNQLNNIFLNSGQIVVATGMRNYTESPGSRDYTAKTIAEAMMGMATVVTPHHSFIPSVSALDIDTNDLFIDVDFNRTYLLHKYIPFDSYWAPGRKDGSPDYNMDHIEVTEENYTWLIEHIERNDELRDPLTGAYHKTLSGYYNFGQPGGSDWDKPFLKHLYSVDIVNGGNLHVNKNGVIGYPGGIYSTTSGSIFTCYTGQNCEQPYIKIQPGGLFEVGDALYNTRGNMLFQENSTLEVFDGGVLRVYDNSTLVIEEGAELILHDGATIDLAGTNAKLVLEGKITLKTNAALNPIGTGKVVFAQPMINATDAKNYWDAAANSKVRLASTNKDVRGIVEQTIYFPSSLDSVSFDGVTVLLEPTTEMHIMDSKSLLHNSEFVGVDTVLQHGGVHLYGNSTRVYGSRFSHATTGLTNILTTGSAMFSVTNCTITFNDVGLFTHDGSAQIEESVLKFNDIGWQAEAAQGSSRIEGGKISYNTSFGVQFNSQAGVTLYASQVALNNNGIGLHVNTADLRPECCNFTNSTTGIAVEGGNFLILNDNAQNVFSNCTNAIAIYRASGLFLEDGYNDFSGSTWYVLGEITEINANPNIDILNNDMPGTGSGQTVSVPINVYWINAQSQQVQVPVVNWTLNVNMPTVCAPPPGGANPGNGLASNILLGFVSTRVVNTTNYTNWWLHEALADAAYMVSDDEGIYDDLLSIARFSEILNSQTSTFTETEEQAFNYSSQLMVTALNNAYEQGLVPQNEAMDGQPEHPYLLMVTSELNERISSTGLSAEEIFEMSLSLAQTYRMAEHYDYALFVLDSVASPTTPEELVYTDYWECVCTAEDALLNEEISPEDFVVEQQICRDLLSQYFKWKRELEYGYSDVPLAGEEQQIIEPLYPNPANNGAVLTLIDQSRETAVQLFDVTGKLVMNTTIKPNTKHHVLDLRNFAIGAYLIKVSQGDTEQVERLIIAR